MTSKSKEGTVCVYLIDHWPKYFEWLNISANKWEKFPKLFSFILFLVLLLHFFFIFEIQSKRKEFKKKHIREWTRNSDIVQQSMVSFISFTHKLQFSMSFRVTFYFVYEIAVCGRILELNNSCMSGEREVHKYLLGSRHFIRAENTLRIRKTYAFIYSML